jgi:hypothetical protein
MGGMPWRELADLPFAAAPRPHRGGVAPRGDYDCEHFDQAAFDQLAGMTALLAETLGIAVDG